MVQTPVRQAATPPSTRGRLPAARRDRRPALAALAVLLILLGALGSALVAFRSGDRASVLVAARDISIGTKVERTDFRSVKMAGNESNLVSAGSLDDVVGAVATVGIPEGTAVNANGMLTHENIVPEDSEEVGVVVNTAQRPGEVPPVGSVVRVYYVTSAGAQTTDNQQFKPGAAVVDAARVTDVSSGGGSDARNITLLVKRTEAGTVASLAATSNLAVTVLPRDTEPDIDLDSGK